MSEPPSSLEERLERLDAIVSRLEGDGLELDDALSLFEEGVRHLREAERTLRDAELRIEKLVAKPGGTVGTEPVDGTPG